MGFHGGAAASKPDITSNAKRQVWCKACQQWRRVLWSEKSDFSQSDGQLKCFWKNGHKYKPKPCGKPSQKS